jgi:iron complex outermembrane receptor protein
MVYFNYAEGFRPNSGADVNGTAFEPEKSESVELGARWHSKNDDLVASVALFSTEKSNILTSDPVNSGFSMALGEAQSSGVEFDLTAAVMKNTELLVNYAYTDAHTNNDMNNPDWAVDIPSGTRLINVPEHTANIILQHFASVSSYDVKLGMHVQYVGERLGETIDPSYELDGYTLTNIFGKLTLNDKVSINASVENIFDENYIANSYSALWNMPGKPLTYKTSIQYSF